MAGDGGEIRPFQRKFDTAWRIGRELIKQIPPARIGLIRRDGAELRLMWDRGLNMNIAHGGSQLTCSLFRGVANPQPVAHIERQRDRQRHYPAGGFETLHRRELPAVGLVVFHHQRHAAFIQQCAQGFKRLFVAEMTQRDFKPQRVQGAGFAKVAREIRVEGAIGHKQGAGAE